MLIRGAAAFGEHRAAVRSAERVVLVILGGRGGGGTSQEKGIANPKSRGSLQNARSTSLLLCKDRFWGVRTGKGNLATPLDFSASGAFDGEGGYEYEEIGIVGFTELTAAKTSKKDHYEGNRKPQTPFSWKVLLLYFVSGGGKE